MGFGPTCLSGFQVAGEVASSLEELGSLSAATLAEQVRAITRGQAAMQCHAMPC